jgi:hypothetical protein
LVLVGYNRTRSGSCRDQPERQPISLGIGPTHSDIDCDMTRITLAVGCRSHLCHRWMVVPQRSTTSFSSTDIVSKAVVRSSEASYYSTVTDESITGVAVTTPHRFLHVNSNLSQLPRHDLQVVRERLPAHVLEIILELRLRVNDCLRR